MLECKASSLKVNVKEEQNHIRKFTLDKGKSFTYKLHKKIEFLNNNIELLKEEFGIDEILSIKGAFILRYPSMILQIKDLKYPIIHISQIERLFND